MAVAKKSEPKTVHLWRCTKCRRTSNSTTKPLAMYGGKCWQASNGLHTWVKER